MARGRVLIGMAVFALAALSGALVASAAARDASKGLTGFGATKAAWMRHHTVDPRFAPFAFFPRQADGHDRYFAVQYSGGRVASYEMDFAPKEPRSEVFVDLHPDLPPDAHRVYDVHKKTCEFVGYRSRLLGRFVGDRMVVFEFSRTATGGAYHGQVGDVIVNGYASPSIGC